MPTLRLSRRQALVALAAGATLPGSFLARAADWPQKPVKILVGAVPGGPSDFLARMLGDAAGAALGQGFVVENKPGASSTLAADAVAKAPADGYTLLVTGPSAVSTATQLFPKLGYNPAQDLVPVAMLGAGAFVLVVHPSLNVNSVQELVALAKAKPGAIAFGSGGTGSSGHLCGEAFLAATGTKMTYAPYKGEAQAMNDLLGGQIQMMFTSPNVALPHGKSGKARVLAVTTRERVASLPDLPSLHEAGVRDFEFLGWIAAFAPARTPDAVIDSLVGVWNKARLKSPIKERLDELAMAAPERIVSGRGLQEHIRNESARLGKIIRDAGIRMD